MNTQDLLPSAIPPVFSDNGELLPENLLWYTKKGELGDALLFRSICTDSLLFNQDKQRWYIYEQGVWREKSTPSVRIMVAPAIQELYEKALALVSIEKESADGKVAVAAKKKSKALLKRLHEFNAIRRSNTILSYVEGLMSVSTDDFDTDRYLLNFTNGTLDTRQNVFREHRPQDMITVQLGYDYDPAATCPEWKRFLQVIFKSNDQLIEFVQKSVSLALSGNNDIEKLFFCYGTGANGKSTFFNVMQKVLSGYYATVSINSLIDSGRGSSNYDIARLPGKRFVSTTEVPEGISLKEEEVKSITSGDTMVVRQIYQAPFEFTPQYLLWVVGNYLPVVRGADLGIWRRILLVPFEVTIPEEERIPKTEMMRIFDREVSGILNWILEGAVKFREYGHSIPSIVQKATSEFKEESNILLPFLGERCEQGSGFSTLTQDVWKDYLQWCDGNKESVFIRTSRSLNNRLRAMGFLIDKGSGNATVVRGLKLKPLGLQH